MTIDAGGDRHAQANVARVTRRTHVRAVSWALLHCGDNCLAWKEHEPLKRPLCALRHRRRHCVEDLASSWARDDEHAFAVAARRRLPTRSTALPFHRKWPAYEAPTKKMLKYCGDELDPKSRTLLDYHPVEVARQNGAGGARRLLCSCERAS